MGEEANEEHAQQLFEKSTKLEQQFGDLFTGMDESRARGDVKRAICLLQLRSKKRPSAMPTIVSVKWSNAKKQLLMPGSHQKRKSKSAKSLFCFRSLLFFLYKFLIFI